MYKEIKFAITSSDGVAIPAIYACNDKKEVEVVIILLHGISTHKDEYLNFYRILSEELVGKGISTLRIDFRGHGESEIPPSGFSISSQTIDIVSSVKWLVDEKRFKKVMLLGTSFGAPPCLFASKLFSNKISDIFMIAPVLDYYRTFIVPETQWGRELFNGIIEKTILEGQRIYITEKFYIHGKLVSEMTCINIENIIKEVNQNIYVMHGDRDSMVNYSITREIAHRNPNIHMDTFRNMDHGFTEYGDDLGESVATRNNLDRIIKIIAGGQHDR